MMALLQVTNRHFHYDWSRFRWGYPIVSCPDKLQLTYNVITIAIYPFTFFLFHLFCFIFKCLLIDDKYYILTNLHLKNFTPRLVPGILTIFFFKRQQSKTNETLFFSPCMTGSTYVFPLVYIMDYCFLQHAEPLFLSYSHTHPLFS